MDAFERRVLQRLVLKQLDNPEYLAYWLERYRTLGTPATNEELARAHEHWTPEQVDDALGIDHDAGLRLRALPSPSRSQHLAHYAEAFPGLDWNTLDAFLRAQGAYRG